MLWCSTLDELTNKIDNRSKTKTVNQNSSSN